MNAMTGRLKLYMDEVSRHRNMARAFKRRLYFSVIAVVGVVFVLAGITELRLSSAQKDKETFSSFLVYAGAISWETYNAAQQAPKRLAEQAQGIRGILLLTLTSITMCVASMLFLSPTARLRWHMLTNRISRRDLNDPIFRRIRPAIEQLMRSLNVDVPVSFWIAKGDPSALPSVLRAWGQHRLVIPAGLFRLNHLDEAAARAMLAHEFGHIAQRDTQLWAFSSLFANRLFAALRIALALQPLIALGFGAPGMFFANIPTFAFLYFRLKTLREQAIGLRLSSERLADQCAIFCVGPGALESALTRLQDMPSHADIHPPTRTRMSQLLVWKD